MVQVGLTAGGADHCLGYFDVDDFLFSLGCQLASATGHPAHTGASLLTTTLRGQLRYTQTITMILVYKHTVSMIIAYRIIRMILA
jgi:hypothetical protein